MRRRVIATPRSEWVDPAVAFGALCRGESPAFWLDSGVAASTGWSYLGVASRTLTASIEDGNVTEWPSGARHEGTILDFLRERQTGTVETSTEAGLGPSRQGPFQLGWVGWLGYELHAQTMGTGIGRSSRYPDAALLLADRVIAFDHATRTVTYLTLDDAGADELAAWRSTVERALAVPLVRDSGRFDPVRSGENRAPTVGWAYSDEEYLAMIESCQRTIAAGDAYQLCLTTEVSVGGRPDPVDTYLRLRELSPSHHGGFVRIGGVSLLSSSPEQFLSIGPDRLVRSKPIKGTRRRGTTPEEDAALRSELLESDKERAENLMIVDLMRNDIGRISEVGSVTVPGLLEVESYAQVHQLVSTVQGRLAPGLEPVDAVAACFPAGSMTGAPKHSAVLTLDGLERRPRGIYSGAFGYFGFDGRIDLAMVIRSIVLDAGGATVGTGGGITALSIPEDELEEVRVKAAALLRALEADRDARPAEVPDPKVR
jgi:anthranilate/para-aminobenzoate synthase component I